MIREQFLKDAIAAKVLESQTVYVVVTDLEGKYTYLNHYFCTKFIVNPEEAIGRDSMLSIVAEDRSVCIKMVQECLSEPGKVVRGKLRKPTNRQEEAATSFWEFQAITDEEGIPVQLLCLGFDLSEHQKVAAELNFKSRLLDTIGQPAVAFDLEGTVTYWNRAAEKTYGYSSEEILGQNISITVQEYNPGDIEAAQSALMAGKQWVQEQIHRDKNGRNFPAKIIDSPIRNEYGEIIGVIATTQDISKEKAHQESIKSHKEQLDKMMQNVPGAVFQMELTPEGKLYFPYISREVSQLYHKLTPELLKSSAEPGFEAVHEDDVGRLKQAIGNAVQGDLSELDLEYRVKTLVPDQYKWNQVRARPELKKGGGIVWYGIFEDINEQKIAAAEHDKLLETTTNQNKRLKDFSFMVSHNIRSSVANLMGLVEMVRAEPANQEYLDMMDLTVNRLNNTISNVNELLNFEQSLDMTTWVPCNLVETITRAIELNNEIIFKKGIQFLVGVPDDLCVNSVPAYLDSIFHNLITNAIKYGTTKNKKTVDIIGIQEGRNIVVRVRDYGIGINLARYEDKIFKLGGRLHRDSRGEGLGLFMTKHQVEALGGTIEVESAEGFGSTFILTFAQ
ncbi:MAG: PAS domain-containing sensor histidine kinase [Phaeodactylibacter sp.]|uniref:PAS domain-containing sensor histidine kinase n=1 Tax=Phaeodactylibacter sp. TaxID=1940289 RepID=UPI0032F04CC8